MKHLYFYRRLAIFSILLTGFVSLNSQETEQKELLRAVQEADLSYYYDQDYEKAAQLYEPIYKANPDNNNLAAKLGICYLNLEGRKAEALELLKEASKNIAADEKEYKEYGDKAPMDTYFYLAIAYHKNDSLEKAIALYTQVKQNLTETETSREEFIDLQIRDCRYAIEMKKKPMRLLSDLFAPWLAEYPGACNPVLAKNDSVFVFTVKQGGRTAIYCSYKTAGKWENPSNITPQIGDYDRLYSNSITGDGRTLILYMDDGGDGNLYLSERTDTIWTRIRNVGRYVNSIYWESHGFITPDGSTMYFASNRPGGEGELDIWISERAADRSWKVPVNCGSTINTPYDENTPYFDTENDALIFSSVGHISMGGYDVFRSTRRGGGWTQPVGMPFAFNNVSENIHFILNNNAPGFIASRIDDKTQTTNIYAIVAVDPAEEITLASGNIFLEDGMEVDPAQARITIKNLTTGKILQDIAVSDSGTFRFEVKPGDYQVFASYPGYLTDTLELNLPLYFMGTYLEVNPSLVPGKVSSGDFLSIQNVLFEYDSASITSEARQSLEVLKNIMITHPELKVEVAGYTDAKGSTDYNRRLADRRAQSVIDYLTATGIESSRFTKRAFGESNFAAVNTNTDGSDNPEGRQYNRRATFGIINPQTGVVLRQEVYTPEHLRQPSSMKYSIILLKTSKILTPAYFGEIISNESLVLRSIRQDTLIIYALGTFFNRTDAVTYLGFLQEKGLKEAYIVNQYDLDNESGRVTDTNSDAQTVATRRVYTVQLKATRNKLDIASVFPGIEGVREVKAEDGYYKYTIGEYESVTAARNALGPFKEMFDDAFIRVIDLPQK